MVRKRFDVLILISLVTVVNNYGVGGYRGGDNVVAHTKPDVADFALFAHLHPINKNAGLRTRFSNAQRAKVKLASTYTAFNSTSQKPSRLFFSIAHNHGDSYTLCYTREAVTTWQIHSTSSAPTLRAAAPSRPAIALPYTASTPRPLSSPTAIA